MPLDSYLSNLTSQLSKMYQGRLSEARSALSVDNDVKWTPLSALGSADQKIALDAFHTLADQQKGAPEMLGGGGSGARANPGLPHAMGAFTLLTEHVGDLSQRMTQQYCERTNYFYDDVKPKLERCLRIARDPYGIEREVNEALKINYNESKKLIPFDQWVSEWKAAATRYSRAHKHLVVYNDAQRHARDSAVALGLLQYDVMTNHLEVLEGHCGTSEQWAAYASLVRIHNNRMVPLR